MYWYNQRVMNKYVNKEVDARFAQQKAKIDGSKSITDLALKSYLQSDTQDANASTADSIDPSFKTLLIGQIKLFLFSGHDTTSASICYLF